MCGKIQLICFHVARKEKIDVINIENPNIVNIKSMRIPPIKTLSFTNMAISGNMQATINVAPVDSKFLISFGSIFVFFNANIIPSGLELAELKIEMAARTKPKRIPATVESTPAVLRISVWDIGLTYLLSNHVNPMLIIMLIIIFTNIISFVCFKLVKSHIA